MFEILKEEPQTCELSLVEEIKAAQIIDKLHMRGTPIDMIDSYLLAGEINEAGLALRSVILENVYEHLQLTKNFHVQFTSKQNPPITVPTGMLLNIDLTFAHCVQKAVYDLTDQCVQPPVYQIATTQEVRDIHDALRTTVLQQVADTTTNLLEQIHATLKANEPTHIRLYPSWSIGTLIVQPNDNSLPIRAVGSHTVIGISAYQLKKKELTP